VNGAFTSVQVLYYSSTNVLLSFFDTPSRKRYNMAEEQLVAPKQPPPLNVPQSDNTVRVSCIDR